MSEVARRTAADDVSDFADGRSSLFSTIVGETPAEKLAILSAVTDSEPLIDHVGETIQLRHFVAQASSVVDEKTGEENDAVRIIVIDADGKAYHAMSKGLYTYMKNLFDIVGSPRDWDAALPVIPTEKRGRNGYRFLTLKLASDVPRQPDTAKADTAKDAKAPKA